MTMATKYYPFRYLLVCIPTTKFTNYREDGYIIICNYTLRLSFGESWLGAGDSSNTIINVAGLLIAVFRHYNYAMNYQLSVVLLLDYTKKI